MTNKFKQIILAICLFAAPLLIEAQTTQIMGSVNDKETGEKIIGANIYFPELKKGAVSDENGQFILSVPYGKYTINVSFLGYGNITQTVKINTPKHNFNFKMIPSVTALNEVVVTSESRSQVSKIKDSPESIEVITADKIRGRASSLETILNTSAGISIKRSGGVGSSTWIAIHGVEGKRVRMYVDDAPVNTHDDSFSLSDIPLNMIERIEIYKGVVPARFGGDGLGGAVNIVTKEYNTDYIDLSYGIGSYNTHKATWVFKKNFEKPGIQIGTGGFYTYSDNDYTMILPKNEEIRQKREHDTYKAYTASASIMFTKLWFDKIKIEGVYYNNNKEIQGILKNISFAHTKSQYFTAALSLEKDNFFFKNCDLNWKTFYVPYAQYQLIDTATYIYSFSGERYKNPVGRGELGTGTPHKSNDKRIELRSEFNIDYVFLKHQNINFHSSFRYAKSTLKDPMADEYAGFSISGFDNTLLHLINGLTLEFKFFNEKLRNNTGIKHYLMNTEVSSGTRILLDQTNSSTTNNMNKFSFNEAIGYYILPSLNLKCSYQYALRLPVAEELFGDSYLISSSPELIPESSNNFNVGFVFNKYQFWGLFRVQLEANAFYMNIRDMIKLQPGIPVSMYTNLGNIEVKGFEADLKVDITKNIYAYYNYTYQSLKDIRKYEPDSYVPNPTSGLYVPNIPNEMQNLGLEYHGSIIGDKTYTKIYWNYQYTDAYYYNWHVSTRQEDRLPAFSLHHVGMEHSINNNMLHIGLEVQNIFDKRTMSEFNMPLPGRTFEVKCRYTFTEKSK
jgi:outer membrane cobalamin receptor